MWRLSVRSSFVCLAVAFAMGNPVLAQAQGLRNLEGHSIIVDYREQIVTPRGSFQVTWGDRIYISTKGRIFHRFNTQSTNPNFGGSFETVGDEAGRGDDRRAKFVWTGQGISRQWTNRRGVTLRQTISITPTGSGYSCHMTIDRFGARGMITPLGQTCRVVSGNVLAGS